MLVSTAMTMRAATAVKDNEVTMMMLTGDDDDDDAEDNEDNPGI